jgi:hypothetical protein
LLLVIGEFPVQARDVRPSEEDKRFKPTHWSTATLLVCVGGLGERIGERRAQRSQRHIGSWRGMNITPSDDGSATRPEPQGHKPAIVRNRMVLPVPGSPTMSTRSPGAISTCRSFSEVQPAGVAISRFSIVNLPLGASTNSIRFSVATSLSIIPAVSRKLAMRSRVARQSAMVVVISRVPAKGNRAREHLPSSFHAAKQGGELPLLLLAKP